MSEIINHTNALEEALTTRSESNLARCYLALRQEIAFQANIIEEMAEGYSRLLSVFNDPYNEEVDVVDIFRKRVLAARQQTKVTINMGKE